MAAGEDDEQTNGLEPAAQNQATILEDGRPDTNPSSRLVCLPVELVIHILESLQEENDMKSFILSSRVIWSRWLLNRHFIVRRWFDRKIHCWPRHLYPTSSGRKATSDPREDAKVRGFLQVYEVPSLGLSRLSPRANRRLNRFYFSFSSYDWEYCTWLARDYSRWTLERLAKCIENLSSLDRATSDDEPGAHVSQYCTPEKAEEVNRLRREEELRLFMNFARKPYKFNPEVLDTQDPERLCSYIEDICKLMKGTMKVWDITDTIFKPKK